MNKFLYAIYDSVSGIYQDAQPHVNDDAAVRSFMLGCGNPAIPDIYLKDLYLYKLGSFDVHSGEVIGFDPVRICSGDSYFIQEYRASLRKEFSNETPAAEETR